MKNDRRLTRGIRDLFLAKQRRRRELAGLPIEKKIHVLVRLQKIAQGIRPRSGRMKLPVWNIRNQGGGRGSVTG